MIVLWLTIINILSSLILLIINLIIFYYYCHHTEKKKVGKSFVYLIVNIGFQLLNKVSRLILKTLHCFISNTNMKNISK